MKTSGCVVLLPSFLKETSKHLLNKVAGCSVLLPSSYREASFIRLSKIAGCTVLLPTPALQKVEAVSSCTVLKPAGWQQEKSGCTAYLKERILHQISNNAGCIVLVPSFLKDELVRIAVKDGHAPITPIRKEAAIIPIHKIAFQASAPHEPARMVRYPRFLNRHKSPRLALHAIR